MNKPAPKPIEIFKAGRHTAMSGAVVDFSESDMQAMVDAYDPAIHEAPLVIGHPKAASPRYGGVGSLALAGHLVTAAPKDVVPEFAEWVGKKLYNKVSASLYAPDAPNNPVPGVYYLRHVGFLGAQPPAIKGLNPDGISFGDAEEGVIEFADYDDVLNASLWRRLRDWLIGEKGLQTADSIIPDYAVSSLEEEARKPDPDDSDLSQGAPAPSFAEETQVDPKEAEALRVENERLKTEAAARDAADKAARTKAAHDGNVAFAEGLAKAGKLRPADLPVVVAFMDFMAADAEGVIEFGEGDAKQSKPRLGAFRSYLENQPKLIEFSEKGGGALGQDTDVDDPVALSNKALEYQETEKKAGRTIDIATAVAHVKAQADAAA